MHARARAVVLAFLISTIIGCDKSRPGGANAAASTTGVAATASAPPTPASTTSASAAPSARASATAPVAASASASASAAAGGSCAPGARKDDDARYCITLPAKKLAVSYEGDKPAAGIREELEIAGDRVVITVERAPAGKTVAQLKEAALKRIGDGLVESGDLTKGYWTDLKDKAGQHIVEGVVVGKFQITCTHWVKDEKNLAAARAVCQSLSTF